jgi:hypothetical protein
MARALHVWTAQLVLATSLGCSSLAAPIQPSQDASEVQLVDQAEFDEMRASGKYVFSDPLGDVATTEACTSGTVDEACIAAARDRLRQTAAERGANLVLVRSAATLQSYPPRYALRGVLYVVRTRA